MIVGFDSCMEQSLEENRVSSFRLVMGEEKERRWKREGGKEDVNSFKRGYNLLFRGLNRVFHGLEGVFRGWTDSFRG